MNKDHEVGRNGLLAFLFGAAIGGIVVALTTPKEGSRLRRDLRKLGAQAKGQIVDWADSTSSVLRQNATAASRQVKDKAEELANKGQEAWKEVKKGASNAGSDMRDGLHNAQEELHV